MTKIREARLTFHMSLEQKAELQLRASQTGLSVPNYLRSLLGWPPERQGTRKDLSDRQSKPDDEKLSNNLLSGEGAV
jgi:hypothetical protein